MPRRIAAIFVPLLLTLAGTAGAQPNDPSHETTTPGVPGLTAETSRC